MYVIVGLGNPGKTYDKTRHNVGFDAIDLLAERNNIKVNKIKFKSVYGEGNIGGEKVLLVKPQTYMNLSGESVRDFANFFKIPLEKLIIIFDDVDINFGSIRVKRKGSSGSHNGLKSIIYQLQDDDFMRVKIGIGKKHENEDLANFVLNRFSSSDRKIVEKSILNASEATELIISKGLNDAMNKYNIREQKEQKEQKE